MRYLSVVLWFLLGLLYYWIWSSNSANCCGDGAGTGMEQVVPLDGDADGADVAKLSDNTSREENREEMDADARAAADAEAKAIADADAEKAIAEAAESKEVTSVKTTTATGAKKLTFYFPYGSNSSSYSSGSEADLKEMVEFAKSSGKKIVVSGHTDSDSSSDFNMRLGKRRADKVRSKIISMGLGGSLVVSESYGETKPIASNDTEAGKQKNRRVELIIE